MSNTKVGLVIGSSIVTACALIYAARARSRNRSLLARTRKQAALLKHQASKLRETAADLIEKGRDEANRQKKHLVNAVEAGRAAYQRVAG
jgi:hypothetical protein